MSAVEIDSEETDIVATSSLITVIDGKRKGRIAQREVVRSARAKDAKDNSKLREAHRRFQTRGEDNELKGRTFKVTRNAGKTKSCR